MNQYQAAALTLTKVFFGTVLGQLVALQVGVLDAGPTALRGALSAGIGAVLVTLYNWLDPKDTRYGRGHE
jgi:hypothetical protein